MSALLRRGGPSQFERASDGSMTLIEHLRELRGRLFKASLGIAVGVTAGMFLAQPVFELLKRPYCNLYPGIACAEVELIQLGPADGFLLRLKLALWIGLIIAAPVWLYQLWAFIAPGLHRHERKWAYVFVAIATPLFVGGSLLAYFVAEKGLGFLLEAGVNGVNTQLEMTRYIDFISGLILLFGAAFEFPLVLLLLNFTGMVTGRRMLGWWRTAIFVCFAFAAITTPDPGPFGMTLFAGALSLLFFISVGVAAINDARRRRRATSYAGLDDDQASPLDYTSESVEASGPITPSAPLDPSYDRAGYDAYDQPGRHRSAQDGRRAIAERYDDTT